MALTLPTGAGERKWASVPFFPPSWDSTWCWSKKTGRGTCLRKTSLYTLRATLKAKAGPSRGPREWTSWSSSSTTTWRISSTSTRTTRSSTWRWGARQAALRTPQTSFHCLLDVSQRQLTVPTEREGARGGVGERQLGAEPLRGQHLRRHRGRAAGRLRPAGGGMVASRWS